MEINFKLGGNEVRIPYRISNRAKYLHIRFHQSDGFEVIVPVGYPLDKVPEFVKKNEDWLEKRISLVKKKEPKTDYFYLLGEKHPIKINFFSSRDFYRFSSEGVLQIELKRKIDNIKKLEKLVEVVLDDLYKAKGTGYLIPLARQLAAKYKFHPKNISIRKATRRYGSCSKQGNISLNYRIMKFRSEVIEYIIIHELCHLKHFNHSKAFWSEVEKYVPNYKTLLTEMGRVE